MRNSLYIYIYIYMCVWFVNISHKSETLPSVSIYINNLIKQQSFVYTQLHFQTVLFLTIQFSISTQFKWQTILLDPNIGPYRVLPLQVRVGLAAMAIKRYSLFPNTPGLEPRHQTVKRHIKDTRCRVGSYPSTKTQSVFSTAQADEGKRIGFHPFRKTWPLVLLRFVQTYRVGLYATIYSTDFWITVFLVKDYFGNFLTGVKNNHMAWKW